MLNTRHVVKAAVTAAAVAVTVFVAPVSANASTHDQGSVDPFAPTTVIIGGPTKIDYTKARVKAPKAAKAGSPVRITGWVPNGSRNGGIEIYGSDGKLVASWTPGVEGTCTPVKSNKCTKFSVRYTFKKPGEYRIMVGSFYYPEAGQATNLITVR